MHNNKSFSYADVRGVTMIEVLMSLMIMSIGISGVAVLFPIAALRSAEATKMTSGASLKYNVEAIVETQPHLVFDPDGDYTFAPPASRSLNNLREHLQGGQRNYIVDPNGAFAMYEAGLTSLSGYFGNFYNSANTPPYEPYLATLRFDGGINNFYPSLSLGDATHVRAMRLAAAELTRLGDLWDTQIDTIAEGFILDNGNFVAVPAPGATVVGVRLPGDVDLSGVTSSTTDVARDVASAILIPDQELSRITVFSYDGAISQSYPLTVISGQDCTWNEVSEDLNLNGTADSRPLPVDFVEDLDGDGTPEGFVAGRVLIERVRSQDFTWFLTVRRGADGRALGVDVVVMYHNGLTPEDERVFTMTPTDLDGDGNADVLGFQSGSFTIYVPPSSGVSPDGDPVEPFVKKGGYVLDADNARWYRITDYGPSNLAAIPNHIKVTLETPVSQTSPGGVGHAIFLPGIVDVFPLGPLELPTDYPALSAFNLE